MKRSTKPRAFALLAAALLLGAPLTAPAQSLSDVILSQQPAGYWRFGETSGTVAQDASGNGRHGTYVGTVQLGVQGGDGSSSDAAVGLPGSGHVHIPGFPVTQSFTVVLWVRSNTATWASHGWLATARSPNGFLMSSNAGTRNVSSVLGGTYLGTATPDDLTRWNQLAISYDAGTNLIRTYLNGRVATDNLAGNQSRSASADVDLYFGHDPLNANLGDGALDEAAVFHRALSAAELLAQWRAATAIDEDQDGVPDIADAFPCDPSLSSVRYVPSQGNHGMVLFEDQWPSRGDLDFNDAVITYSFSFAGNAAGEVGFLHANFNALAVGGLFDNGLGLALPVPASSVLRVVLNTPRGAVELSPEPGHSQLVVRLGDDLRTLFFDGQRGQINSDEGSAAIAGRPVELQLEFTSPQALDVNLAPFDLFLFRTHDLGHELHRPEYAGTAAMRGALFGTADDGSTPGRWFVDGDGLPFALHLPRTVAWPREGRSIDRLYPDIVTFAQSAGAQGRDFYSSQVVVAESFRQGAGGSAAPLPRFVGPDDLMTGGIGCLGAGSQTALQFGSSGSDAVLSLQRAPNEELYATGTMSGSLPGFTHAGVTDVLVARVNLAARTLSPLALLGSPGIDEVAHTALGAGGELVGIGLTYGALLGLPPPPSGTTGFLYKLAPDGQLLWARQVQAPTGLSTRPTGVAVGSQDEIYALSVSGGLIGGATVVERYDALGGLEWSQVLDAALFTGDPTLGGVMLRDLQVHPNGDLYATGETCHVFPETPASGAPSARCSRTLVLACLSPEGTLRWMRHLESPDELTWRSRGYQSLSSRLHVGPSGELYAAGTVLGGVVQDYHGQPISAAEALVVKWSPGGELLWVRTVGGEGYDYGYALDLDLAGNVYVGGQASMGLYGQSLGGVDGWLARLDPQGNAIWSRSLGTSASDTVHTLLATTPSHVLYVGGQTAGQLGATVFGGHDAFILRVDALTGQPLP